MSPDAVPDATSPLRRLFLGRRPARGVVWFALPGGQTLYTAGAPSEALYMVRSGRLAVLRAEEGRRPQVIGVVRPGEPVGEMALIAGTPHAATVVALRDSEVLALPREAFLLEARRRPLLMAELARLSVLRARAGALTVVQGEDASGEPNVFGFLGVAEGAPVRPTVERLARRLRGGGLKVAVAGSEALRQTGAWFSALEQAHDLVLLAAEAREAEWRQVCLRQLDQLFWVARTGGAAPAQAVGHAEEVGRSHRPADLVLTRRGDEAQTSGAQAWLDALGAGRLHHLRDGSEADLGRLTRLLTGRSTGLVLSGGGARAYAHVGVLRALREADAPVDMIGGASMGAIIGAGVCLGWDPQELDARVRAAFVSSNPVGDMAFPMVAMSGGRRVKARLQEHFGDAEIADLHLPFFCVSSNLTTGLPKVHDAGRLVRALRASSALPGVIPPVVEDDEILVDGGVLRNLPTDIMRERCRGPVVGVDVALTDEVSSEAVARPPSLWRFLVSGAWRRGPPIVSLLIRSATVTTHREFAAAREASDLLVAPLIEGVGLQDWRAYDQAVEAGYRAASEALERLDRPLADLRRPRDADPADAAGIGPALGLELGDASG